MAWTLVSEFQHIKLSALLDMFPLIEPCADRGYAPWRDDPRPMGGILQGVCAFPGIVRFWDVQRRLEAPPDEVLKANVLYERWRLAIDLVSGTLLGNGSLTPTRVAGQACLGSGDTSWNPRPCLPRRSRSPGTSPSTTGSPGSSGTRRSMK